METLNNLETLKETYSKLKSEQPKLRIRDAAKVLNVSEMELLLCDLGNSVSILRSEPQAILSEIHRIGKVMALTRNEYVVHERVGVYENVSFSGDKMSMGLVVNPDIDLRLFMSDWKHVFACKSENGSKTMYSIQFFDSRGEAVHKIYTKPESDVKAYQSIVEKYKSENQVFEYEVDRTSYPQPEYSSDDEVDLELFRKEWIEMEDTHHFFGMLRRHKLQRQQALRLAPEGYAQKVPNECVVKMLNMASEQEVPIMVFVGNRHCIQIHTGQVHKIFPMGSWINVMDPLFNLHLNTEGISESWIVKKSTNDGIVTSLELFDEKGELIVYFFGERKPGKVELESWRKLIVQLENH